MFSELPFLILVTLTCCSFVSAIPQAFPSTSLLRNATSSSSYIWHAPHISSSISACIAPQQSTSSSTSNFSNTSTNGSLTQVPGTEQITTTLTLMPTTVTSTDTWPVTQSAETELISTTFTATEMIPTTVISTDTWPVTQAAATQLLPPVTIDVGPTSQAAASASESVSASGPWTQSAATQLLPISSSSTSVPSSTPALGAIINSFAGGSQSDTTSAAATSSILATGAPKTNAALTSSTTTSSAPQGLSSLLTVISGTTDLVIPNPTTIPINSILSLLHGSTTVISGVTQVIIPAATTASVNGSRSNFAQASSAAKGDAGARTCLLGFIFTVSAIVMIG